MINNFDEMSEDKEKSFDVCYEFEGAGVVEKLAFDTLIEEVNECEDVFDITNISRQRLARR
ncbi:hypothetical protein Peur_020848 [Populus x canadensis]